MKIEGTNSLLLPITAFLELIYVAKGHIDKLQKADKYPIKWSL